MALLKLRGRDLFQTVVGRKIFLILRGLLVRAPIPLLYLKQFNCTVP